MKHELPVTRVIVTRLNESHPIFHRIIEGESYTARCYGPELQGKTTSLMLAVHLSDAFRPCKHCWPELNPPRRSGRGIEIKEIDPRRNGEHPSLDDDVPAMTSSPSVSSSLSGRARKGGAVADGASAAAPPPLLSVYM